MTKEHEFGRIRSFIWPVHPHEHKKFIPMLLIFFLICFNYNILRATKDTLVCTARASGAEALPFLKVWAVIPMAFLMTFIYTRVCNRMSREKVFYAMMGIFLGFFLLFALVLYPYRDQLHPHELADYLQSRLPIGFKGLIAIFRNWTFSAFYIMSEMWSTMMMTVLFWGFANDVTSVKDAKRFYGLLGISANFSGVVSGQVSTWLSWHAFNPALPFGRDGWEQSVGFLMMIVIATVLICMAMFRWIHIKGVGYPREETPHLAVDTGGAQVDKRADKMGLRKIFAYLAKSDYLICIAIIVVTYNIAINLTEVVWKDQVKQLYPNPNDFNAYMGKIFTGIGIVATATSIFISGNVIRRFSWASSAMIPPMILVVTGIGFFSFLLFKDMGMGALAAALNSTPLAIGVFFGSMQNCLSRASKYTLFDSTKELAFVPLSTESKRKGKAAIDGIGSRLGKSGGSLILQGLILAFGTLGASTPYVAVILLVVVVGWMVAVKALGKRFDALAAEQKTINVLDGEPKPSTEPASSPALT